MTKEKRTAREEQFLTDWLHDHKNADEIVVDKATGLPTAAIYWRGRHFPVVYRLDGTSENKEPTA